MKVRRPVPVRRRTADCRHALPGEECRPLSEPVQRGETQVPIERAEPDALQDVLEHDGRPVVTGRWIVREAVDRSSELSEDGGAGRGPEVDAEVDGPRLLSGEERAPAIDDAVLVVAADADRRARRSQRI